MTFSAVAKKPATDMPALVSGLSFLQPAALWALMALAIPALIHLFNRSRGRLVKIGHIDLIKNARKLRVTELILSDWLLLLLRICLFALAAVVLAGLALPGLSSSDKATAYVSPAWLLNAQPQAVSDLLTRYSDQQAARVFLLQDGFPVLDSQLADAVRQDSTGTAKIHNIWPLLANRLSLEHHQGDVEVYAVDNLAQFGELRPSLPKEVSWNLSHFDQSHASHPVAINAIVAYKAKRKADAEVFDAAFTSLKAHRLAGLRWKLVEVKALATEQQQVDWLILLSGSSVNASLSNVMKSAKVVLTDAYGEAGNSTSQLLRVPFYPFSEFRVNRTGRAVDGLRTLLALPNNQVLLQQGRTGGSREIHFNSRFHPAWSSIAAQPEFPELLLQLLMADKLQQLSFADARVLPSQLETAASPGMNAARLPRRSLQSLLAGLMVLIWLAERWLSERRPRVRL